MPVEVKPKVISVVKVGEMSQRQQGAAPAQEEEIEDDSSSSDEQKPKADWLQENDVDNDNFFD